MGFSETRSGVLYMVGKIFLYGVSFDRVYNESAHENMKENEKIFFPHVASPRGLAVLT